MPIKKIFSNQDLECEFCESNIQISKIVVSRGNPRSRLMLIGEAPGAKEDLNEQPFVGRSGKLLDRLLKDVGINSNEDAYFCNVVKCRPPKNRKPSRVEINSAKPWLYQQILLVDPWIIVLIGATAIESLLGKNGSISDLRGRWQTWDNRLVMPIFHPSYLLRNPSKSEGKPFSLTVSDMKKVRNKLDEFNIIATGSDLTGSNTPKKL